MEKKEKGLNLSIKINHTLGFSSFYDLRDNSTSTLLLVAAFVLLVKTLLTFFKSLAVSVNL